MASTTCLFWIKFFTWIFVSGGIALGLNFIGLNIVISSILSGILGSPILFADYIMRYAIEKKKRRNVKEEGRLKQEILENPEYNQNNIILCTKSGKKKFI